MKGPLVLTVALLACGCGDDPVAPLANGAEHPVIQNWDANTAMGYALINFQNRSATDLSMQRCEFDAQFARSTNPGELRNEDSEGPCVVSDSPGWQGQTELTPACAANLTFGFGGDSQGFSYCPTDTFPNSTSLDCGRLSGSNNYVLQSPAEEAPEDEVGAIEVSVARPNLPMITSPAMLGDGFTAWPTGDLVVEWQQTGTTGVEIVLGRTDVEDGRRVRCLVPDTGSFTVPARLTEPYRVADAALEVAALEQTESMAGEFSLRATFRVSDSIRLIAE